jgi:hypothetical protein
MATTLSHPEKAAAFVSSPIPETGAGRLVSLDAFRGFIMLLLVSNGFGLGVLEHYPNWCGYRILRPRRERLPLYGRWALSACILALVLTLTLDSQELKFLIRQVDKFIQVMEFMSRKNPAVDHEELAVVQRLKDKLDPVDARRRRNKLARD